MIFVNRDEHPCACAPAPGLPIRPGLAAPEEPTVVFNQLGGFSFAFGNYDIPGDIPDVSLAVLDLDGRLVSGSFMPTDMSVARVGTKYVATLTVAPALVTASGTYQLVVYATASSGIIFTAWLLQAPARVHQHDIFPTQNSGVVVATRSGTVTLTSAQFVDIVFATPFTSVDYVIPTRELRYTPGGDPTSIVALAVITNKTYSGFRQWFMGETSADFAFDYIAAL